MKTTRFWSVSILLSVAVASVAWAQDESDPEPSEIEQLRTQIAQMKRQLDGMQAQLSRFEQNQETSEDPQQTDPQSPQTVAALDQRISNLENVSDEWIQEIDFGGAVRLNYAWRDFDEQNKDRFGDFEFELFRINTDGKIGDVLLSAEWRRYNDFQAIHHAWVGYEFNDQAQIQVGISQVPFGLLPFASHSFWFGGTYYLGFEDDYDTGIKMVHEPNEDWTFHYAFYRVILARPISA
ncbi:MAG: hypothetical protein LC637_10765 [Xanthomonadaceae bacterium]|nr:hypothetical protein [Xanthomonadaceae bacterium]